MWMARSGMHFLVAVALSGLVVSGAGCTSPERANTRKFQRADEVPFGRLQADRALKQERFDDAIDAYRELHEQGISDPVEAAIISYQWSRAYWGRAASANRADPSAASPRTDRESAVTQARDAFDRLEVLPPDRRRGLFGPVARTLATYLHASGDLDGAADVLDRTLRESAGLDEDRALTLYELGNIHFARSGLASADEEASDSLTAALRCFSAARKLVDEREDGPAALEAAIGNALGLVHNARLQPDLAIRYFSDAERVCRERDAAAPHAEVLENLTLALIEAGRYEEAGATCDQLDALAAATSDPRTMAGLGLARLRLGDLAEARKQFDLARLMAAEDPESRTDSAFMAQLACNAAGAAQAVGAFDEAERYLTEARRQVDSADVDPHTAAIIQANLGRMYLTLERLDEAETQLESALATLSALRGPQHPDTLRLQLDVANLARARGYFVEARQRCESALRGLAAARGRDHPLVGQARLELAAIYRDEGNCPEALAEAVKAMKILDARLGKDHKQAVLACLRAALYAADCGDGAEGETSFSHLQREATSRFARLRDALGAEHVEVLQAMVYFADIAARTPAAQETALRRYRAAEQGFLKLYGDGTKSLAALRLKQGRLLQGMGRLDEAARIYDLALRRLDRGLQMHPIHAELLAALGDIDQAMGRKDRATRRWKEALRILTAAYGPDHPRVRQFIAKREE